jgi:hypothetical protein
MAIMPFVKLSNRPPRTEILAPRQIEGATGHYDDGTVVVGAFSPARPSNWLNLDWDATFGSSLPAAEYVTIKPELRASYVQTPPANPV